MEWAAASILLSRPMYYFQASMRKIMQRVPKSKQKSMNSGKSEIVRSCTNPELIVSVPRGTKQLKACDHHVRRVIRRVRLGGGVPYFSKVFERHQWALAFLARKTEKGGGYRFPERPRRCRSPCRGSVVRWWLATFVGCAVRAY
jgi:hypothetical protein